MKIFIFITLFFTQLVLQPSFADTEPIHIAPEKEIDILESLDIDPLFYNDEHYIETKEKINELKRIYFLRTLKRGNLFMPNLQELLNESDIPSTFLYMAMVESKFLADSKSHKHAAGLWQFMPATAKEYKLRKDREIDERLDPIKSTKAAIQYLKYLYSRFQKWYLAAMAYNCGERRLANAIKKAGTDDLAVLLDEKEEYLPKETRDYIRRIIVAALLANDKNIIKKNNKNHLFGFCSNKKLTKLYFKGGESLQTIAYKIGVPYKKLKACNPHLIKNRLPVNKKMYYVYLPEDLAEKAKEKIKKSGETFVYYVQPNDTLFRISRRFNIRMKALRELNPQLEKHKVLKIGMPLTLLGKAPKDLPQTPPEKMKKKHIVKTYTVESDTSLYELSLKFNNRLAALKKLNPGIKKKVKAGTKIKIVTTLEKNKTKEGNISIASFKTKTIITETNTTQTDKNETNTTQTDKNETNTTILVKQKEKRGEQNKTIQTKTEPKLSKTPKKLPVYKTVTHMMEKNDTLEKIAKHFNLKISDIFKEGNVLILKIKENNTTLIPKLQHEK
jgi:membrane-bound lytic murein transglycosylase D